MKQVTNEADGKDGKDSAEIDAGTAAQTIIPKNKMQMNTKIKTLKIKTLKTPLCHVALALAAGLLPLTSSAEEADIPVKGSIPLARETAETAYAVLAKVPIAEAIRIGAEKQPGTVTKAELVEDDGFLVWEVDVVGAKATAHEVVIDAGNGKVLAVEVDHADNDEEAANAKEDRD